MIGFIYLYTRVERCRVVLWTRKPHMYALRTLFVCLFVVTGSETFSTGAVVIRLRPSTAKATRVPRQEARQGRGLQEGLPQTRGNQYRRSGLKFSNGMVNNKPTTRKPGLETDSAVYEKKIINHEISKVNWSMGTKRLKPRSPKLLAVANLPH